MKHGMGSIAGLVAAIGGLKAKIQANKQKIEAAKGMIASSKTQVAQITRTIATLTTKMEEMNGWMGKIIAEVQEIDSASSNKLNPKVQQSASLTNHLKQLENRFKNNYLKKYGIAGVDGYSTGKVNKLPYAKGSKISDLPYDGQNPKVKKTLFGIDDLTVGALAVMLVLAAGMLWTAKNIIDIY